MARTSPQRDPMTVGGLDLAAQVAANRRRSAIVLVALGSAAGAMVAVVLVVAANWLVAVAGGLVTGVGVTWLAFAAVPGRAMRLAGGTRADPGRQPRLHNLVEGLALAAGVPQPELFVLPAPGLNALSVGLDPRRARVVVTSGLLEHLSRIELEAVLAHELSHIRGLDTRTATLAAGLFGLVGPLRRPAGAATRWLLGPQRETLADLRGASLTRYPPGLISALEVMGRMGTEVPGAPAATAPLWMVPADGVPDPQRPSLESRIEALREL